MTRSSNSSSHAVAARVRSFALVAHRFRSALWCERRPRDLHRANRARSLLATDAWLRQVHWQGTRRQYAAAFSKQLKAVRSRLTIPVYQEYKHFYLGTFCATLGDNEKACALPGRHRYSAPNRTSFAPTAKAGSSSCAVGPETTNKISKATLHEPCRPGFVNGCGMGSNHSAA